MQDLLYAILERIAAALETMAQGTKDDKLKAIGATLATPATGDAVSTPPIAIPLDVPLSPPTPRVYDGGWVQKSTGRWAWYCDDVCGPLCSKASDCRRLKAGSPCGGWLS